MAGIDVDKVPLRPHLSSSVGLGEGPVVSAVSQLNIALRLTHCISHASGAEPTRVR